MCLVHMKLGKLKIAETSECGGGVSIIACIEDPQVIRKILNYLDDNASPGTTLLQPECRAPPRAELLKRL